MMEDKRPDTTKRYTFRIHELVHFWNDVVVYAENEEEAEELAAEETLDPDWSDAETRDRWEESEPFEEVPSGEESIQLGSKELAARRKL